MKLTAIKVMFLAATVSVFAACSAPNIGNMTFVQIDEASVPQRLKGKVHVGEVVGEVKGLSIMLLGVTTKEQVKNSFKSSLEQSLEFAGLKGGASAPIVIHANVKKLASSGIFSTTKDMEVVYRYGSSDMMDEFVVKSSATVTMNEERLGDRRALRAIERAVESNIQQFFEKLVAEH